MRKTNITTTCHCNPKIIWDVLMAMQKRFIHGLNKKPVQVLGTDTALGEVPSFRSQWWQSGVLMKMRYCDKALVGVIKDIPPLHPVQFNVKTDKPRCTWNMAFKWCIHRVRKKGATLFSTITLARHESFRHYNLGYEKCSTLFSTITVVIFNKF